MSHAGGAALAALLVLLPACTARTPKPAASAQAVERAEIVQINPASANDGGRVYIKNCSSCHQADGRGVPGAFPPLAGNELVTGNPLRTITIVKFGFSGKTRVMGADYNGTMPAWGQLISDDEIASVVSYIRGAWHNDAKPVTLGDVSTASR
ncbi:MAG TPA: cytochrome c [Candidatus Baltobacteraceae bacterium]|nr:cytochrome c [Candidatus Baltobacteraceae bacterium]